MLYSLIITRIDNGFLMKWTSPHGTSHEVFMETIRQVVSKTEELVAGHWVARNPQQAA